MQFPVSFDFLSRDQEQGWMVDDEDVKEKVTLTLFKVGKKSFIQNYCDQCQDYAVG